MRTSTLLGLTITVTAVLACGNPEGPGGGSGDGGGGGGGGGGSAAVLLKDVVVSHLPSPYYHFEYEPGGQITRVSFASDFLIYDVLYQDSMVTELRNITAGNMDRLHYVYDAAGRVDTVNYLDATGIVFTRVLLTYDGDKLIRLDRERKLDPGFTIDKTMSFSYYADGNLQEIVEHRPAVNGQEATTTVDRFEQYDENVNVDAFGLIHDDFFDHVVLLPHVQLQKGNPALEIFTGVSTNYRFEYTYTYDEHKRPLTKGGTATILTGPDSGRTIPLSTVFSYY